MNHDENKQRVCLARNLSELHVSEHEWDLFAIVRKLHHGTTKAGKPFVALQLGDQQGGIAAKVWSDASDALAACKVLREGAMVKLRGTVSEYQGNAELTIKRIKELDPKNLPDDLDPAQLIDPALSGLEELVCRTLVFDIETVPAVDRRELPPTVAEALSAHASKREMEPGKAMGLSPFFGKVISLALCDGERDGGEDDVTVLAVAPDGVEVPGTPSWLRLMSEADLLRSFWALAGRAETVVTFNGRGFDVPFLVMRSLIHGIPARVDLMSNRFSLRPHLDLYELLSNRGGPSKLDVICWALGIASPKEEMDGSMVAPAYERGEIVEIATYNRHDVVATSAVYRRVRDGILRFRGDWSPPH